MDTWRSGNLQIPGQTLRTTPMSRFACKHCGKPARKVRVLKGLRCVVHCWDCGRESTAFDIERLMSRHGTR